MIRRTVLVICLLAAPGCLRVPAQEAAHRIGYAVDPGPLADDTAYRNAISLDAEVVTPENHMKWSLVHPGPDTYDFEAADRIVAFARAAGQDVRGHTLLWHRQLPGWFTSRSWTRAELIEVLRDHIFTVVGHFRSAFPGVVTEWDVVNEAFNPDGSRRSTIWQNVIGDDYIELAFRFAHEADPDAELFYNDFYEHGIVSAEAILDRLPPGPGATSTRTSCDAVPKCVATRSLARDLLSRGVPLHGIGFQGHIFGTDAPDYGELSAWTAPLGLTWALTELDIALPAASGDDPAMLRAQADAYGKVVGACVRSPNCDTVVLWGVGDGHSWIPSTTAGLLDHALIRRVDYSPKPAYAAVWQALTEGGA